MPAIRLSEQYLQKVEAADVRREISDAVCQGLRIRISPARDGIFDLSWSFVYRSGKNVERVSLGKWPALTLSAARKRTDELRVLKARGGSPAGNRREERAVASISNVDEMVSKYLVSYASKKKSKAQYEAFLRPFARRFGTREPSTLRRAELIEWLDGIADRAPVSANRTQAHLSGLFAWAVERDRMTVHLLKGVKRRAKETAKSYRLDSAEILQLWRRGEEHISVSAHTALKLILLTAARPGEVAGLHVRELEFKGDESVWRLPKERTKSKQERPIPLGHVARKLIELRIAHLERNGDAAGYLFPSRVDPSKPATAAFLPQAVVTFRERTGGMLSWTAHDLRRTAATLGSEAGVHDEDIAALLGHAAIGVTGRVYNQNKRLPEMRRAVEAIERAVRDAYQGAAE